MSEKKNNDIITLTDIQNQVKIMREEVDSIRKARLKQALLSGLLLPFIVCLASLVGTYEINIKPDRIKSQTEFQFINYVNNINRVQDRIEELKEKGEPTYTESQKLDEVKEYSESFNDYYDNGKFTDALNEMQDADKDGREKFPDDWTKYPYLSEEGGYF